MAVGAWRQRIAAAATAEHAGIACCVGTVHRVPQRTHVLYPIVDTLCKVLLLEACAATYHMMSRSSSEGAHRGPEGVTAVRTTGSGEA